MTELILALLILNTLLKVVLDGIAIWQRHITIRRLREHVVPMAPEVDSGQYVYIDRSILDTKNLEGD